MKSENVMQLPHDIYVNSVTFRPHTLCILLNHFSRGVGCQQLPKTHGN